MTCLDRVACFRIFQALKTLKAPTRGGLEKSILVGPDLRGFVSL
ncbi:hypothetical protein HC081234_08350 [Helicobacter cinaedi]|nr:hypothetical protein HC081234_08350 [Helicobacter cinaedi]